MSKRPGIHGLKRVKAAACLACAILLAAGKPLPGQVRDPDEYPYQWRLPTKRIHVLWIGGGHWHDTLTTAAELKRSLEGSGKVYMTYTEDLHVLTRLEPYDVIVLNGMIDSMEPACEKGLLASVSAGKALLVLHAASASFRKPPPEKPGDPPADHPDFYEMLGGYVYHHPPLAPFAVIVRDRSHPVTQGVDDFVIEDELFLFQNLRADNHVLLESEHEGVTGPLAWTRDYGKGTVLHIALGHGRKAARNPVFLRLIGQGIDWLAGREYPDENASPEERD